MLEKDWKAPRVYCSFFLGYWKQWQSYSKLSWWDVPGRFQCQPFTSSLGTTGRDLDPAFGCPRNHHTNRKSHKVKNDDMDLVLSWYQHASERVMIHLVLTAWFIPVQFPRCFPFFLLSTKRKMISIIFHDWPYFPAYPPLTLKEKVNFTERHIKIFTYIRTGKWAYDLAFSRLILSIR